MESVKFALITICNDDYVDVAGTMIYSFVWNNPWFTGDIIICCDHKYSILSEDNRDKLKLLYPRMIFREVDTAEYEELIEYCKPYLYSLRYIPSAYTYEVFDLHGYDKVLYLDADMIILESIQELFEDPHTLGMVRLGTTYNAGMILSSPKRNEGLKQYLLTHFKGTPEKLLEILEEGVIAFNEDALGIQSLPKIYNFPSKGTRMAIKPKIVHFLNDKIWSTGTTYTKRFYHKEWLALNKQYYDQVSK